MKIVVYAIAKNEAKFMRRWLQTVKEADDIVLVDTGSTDGTEAFATHRITVQPFRFDDARNAALALVPSDVDVCVALDLDEILYPGWRAALEKAWMPGANNAAVSFIFNGQKPFMQSNRVHSRHGWRWRYPCHEGLYRSIASDVMTVQCPGFIMAHFPDTTKPRPNYLELLAWGQWENPTSLRMLHYYGRELMFNGYHKDALERFERYMQLEPSEPFPYERTLTEGYIKNCRFALSQAGQ